MVDAISGAVLVSAAAMNLIAGTAQVYTYALTTTGIAEGTYLAVASYATAAATVNNLFLETVRLGDSRVTGPVALEATVANGSLACSLLARARWVPILFLQQIPSTASSQIRSGPGGYLLASHLRAQRNHPQATTIRSPRFFIRARSGHARQGSVCPIIESSSD